MLPSSSIRAARLAPRSSNSRILPARATTSGSLDFTSKVMPTASAIVSSLSFIPIGCRPRSCPRVGYASGPGGASKQSPWDPHNGPGGIAAARGIDGIKHWVVVPNQQSEGPGTQERLPGPSAGGGSWGFQPASRTTLRPSCRRSKACGAGVRTPSAASDRELELGSPSSPTLPPAERTASNVVRSCVATRALSPTRPRPVTTVLRPRVYTPPVIGAPMGSPWP